MAREARREAELDEVWLMPALSPPHKPSRLLSPYADRLAMTRIMALEEPFLDVCRIEESLPRPGYSVRSILALKRLYPATDFIFIIGEDSLEGLEGWKDPDLIFRETEVLVLARDGFEVETSRPCRILRGVAHPAQSRIVRREIASGEPGRWLIAGVREYIRNKGLYGKGEIP